MTEDHGGPGKPEDRSPTLWQTIMSINAALFGVHSSHNRQRVFAHGRPRVFIVVKLLITALFVVGVVLAVNLALRSAGL